MPTALDIAKYIIVFNDCKGDIVTNKKLQKLLYYVQAWSLVHFEYPFFDEYPEAWSHGPVYPTVYQRYKIFGYQPIALDDYQDGIEAGQLINNVKSKIGLTDDQLGLVDTVLTKYGSLSPAQLEILTHSEKPWLEKRVGLSEFERSDNTISFETMKEYYSGLLKKSKHVS